MKRLRSALEQFDTGLARGEAAVATGVLLLMVVMAAVQAFLYNVSTKLELDWAHSALTNLTWIDAVLQKGTLWLAFIGASLATRAEKHISIDALRRFLPKRPRLMVRTLVAMVTGVTALLLARVFFSASLGAQDRPVEYEVLLDAGAAHVCDAPAAALAASGITPPSFFCGVRWCMEQLGIAVETPVGVLLLIVPAMLIIIGVRFVARALDTALTLGGVFPEESGEDGGEQSANEESH